MGWPSIDEANALECVGEGWAPLIKRLYAAMPEGTEVVLTIGPFWSSDSWFTGKWCHICPDGTRTAHELKDVCGDDRRPSYPMPPSRPIVPVYGW